MEWGEPIRVDGVRPDWLDDDNQPVGVGTVSSIAQGTWYGAINSSTKWVAGEFGPDWVSICLPADHPRYKENAMEFSKMTPLEAHDWWKSIEGEWDGSEYSVVFAMRRLGLIRTPTRAETIAAKAGVAVDVVERVLGVMGDE